MQKKGGDHHRDGCGQVYPGVVFLPDESPEAGESVRKAFYPAADRKRFWVHACKF
jgi:hypothetical protein